MRTPSRVVLVVRAADIRLRALRWWILLVLLLATHGGSGVRTQTASPPILVIVNAASPNPFGAFLPEILRAEGLNTFNVAQLSSITASTLSQARVVVLAETPLTDTQATLLSNYVTSGGRLVAMRPDARLAPTLGITPQPSSTSEGYIAINAGTTTGSGLQTITLPFHGTAQNHALQPGATMLATLYSDRTTATAFPAVIRSGNTVTWAYDLPRSIVYARQGNPANAGVDRFESPLRTSDIFADAIDKDRVPVPHADIQMRLLSRVIEDLIADTQPMPKLWYFPSGKRTLLVLTGDAHWNANELFQDVVNTVSARGAHISLYLARWGAWPTTEDVAAMREQGHEFGLHPYGAADGHSLDAGFTEVQQYFADRYTHESPTVRTHQIEWQGWVDGAKIEANHGLQLDTSFYTWGQSVTYPDGHQAHGYITGSSLPMRFIDETGAIVPVYQQATTLIDEQLMIGPWSELMSAPAAFAVSREIIDNSEAGNYAALTTQFHVDYIQSTQPWIEQTLDYANALAIPMWTAERWLNYTKARSATALNNLSWTAGSRQLSFQIVVPVGSEALSLTLPGSAGGFGLTTATVDGSAATPVQQTINGRVLNFIEVGPGTHSVLATYNSAIPPPQHPPVATNDVANVTAGQSVQIPVLANDGDPDGDTLSIFSVSSPAHGTTVTNPDKTITYTPGPGACGTDTFNYTVTDGRSGLATATVTISVVCLNGDVKVETMADFTATCSASTGTIATSAGDGEIRLAGTRSDEFSGDTLDSSRWVSGNWSGGAYTPTFSGGVMSLGSPSGAFVRSATPLPVTTIDTSTRFTAASWEHVGWAAQDFNGPYLVFSTYYSSTNLYARSNTGSGEQTTDLGSIPAGFHSYRITRQALSTTSNQISYYIDGVLRAQHTVGAVDSLYVYQSGNGGATPTLDIDRLWIYPDYTTAGTFQSCTLDMGQSTSNWTTAAWLATVPGGTSMRVRTRTSNDASSWSGWSAPLTISGQSITSPQGRYLQFLLELTSTDPQQSPIVDSVTMQYSDGFGTPNNPPVANADSANTAQGVAVSVPVLTNDTDPDGDTLTVTGVAQPSHGAAAINGGTTVLYTPATGYCGPDAFAYNIGDGHGGTSSATVSVVIACPANIPPVVVDDAAVTSFNTPVSIAVLANDSDGNGEALTVSGTGVAGRGVATIGPGGLSVIYTPTSGVCGPDVFTYTASDNHGGFATGTVDITVGCSGAVTHTTVADFATCASTPAGTQVTHVADGEVQLAGTFNDYYSAATLDPQWTAGTWAGGAYTPSLAAGVLSVGGPAGGFVRSTNTLPVNTLSSRARFSNAAWQHLGWASLDFSFDTYLIFSTFNQGTRLYARSNLGLGEQRTDLGVIPAGFHDYRLDVVTDSGGAVHARYLIDGIVLADHVLSQAVPPLYVYQSNNAQTAAMLDVDSITAHPPLAANGTFDSCPIDAGVSVTWQTASWVSTVPEGTALAVQTRTSQDASTWSAWSPALAASGATIASPAGRFAQYRLNLSTTNGTATPSVESVTIASAGSAPAQPVLTIGNASIPEGGTGASTIVSLPVTLNQPSTGRVRVNYTTVNGTATAGSDYQASSGTLVIPAGATSATINVTVSGDAVDENDETFSVALSAPVNATLGNTAGTVTIVNDDFGSLSINDVTLTETNTTTQNAVFTVTLSAATTRTVTVNYATANGTATAGSDYTAVNGTLTFTPGALTRTITVPVLGDTLDEVNETFSVVLSNPTNATLADAIGTGTIIDNDSSPSLSIGNATVTEGNAGTVPATFTVTLSAVSGRAVTVNYATSNGSATAGSDYVAASGTVTFPIGSTSQTITVLVNGDTLDENNETFTVTLTNADGATINDSSGTGTINDDDPSPTLSINDVTVTEGNSGTTNAVFTVTMSAVSGRAVTVNYATANGTATAGSDYSSRSGTLTFNAGQTTQTITVPVTGDTAFEATETFSVNLTGPNGATVADGTGIGTITNDDSPPTLSINDVSVQEPLFIFTTTATFTVTLSAPSSQTITVAYATANGTAVAPGDYTAASGTLTFSPGTTTQTISITIRGDMLNEPTETYTVNLSNPSNATISDASGTGTIINR